MVAGSLAMLANQIWCDNRAEKTISNEGLSTSFPDVILIKEPTGLSLLCATLKGYTTEQSELSSFPSQPNS